MSDSNFLLKRIGTYELSGVRLGKGNFAYVELATNRITQTKVAIKIIDIRKIKDEYVKKNILREASILKKVRHPNIVRLYETLKQRSLYCLVTEYVDGGELLCHLRSQRDCRFSESQARPIVRQMVSALHHLHEQGIVHRDLKMENVLLDQSKQQIKIIDFGLSNACSQNEFLKTQCGSPEYAAPELFKKGCRYGTEVDIWSLGVNVFGMVVGRLPFRTSHCGGRGHNELVDQMNRGLYTVQGRHMTHLTPECKDLLLRLLEPNPQQRLALLQIMEHPWVTQKGVCPLVPYSPPEVDDELMEKVLDKASALIKIRKQKIRMHVERNRYDAICSIYNMLLDQEIKNLYGGRFCGDFEFEFEPEASSSDDEQYLLRGKAVSCPEYGRYHDQSEMRHQEMSHESGNEVMVRDINSRPRNDSEDATALYQSRTRQQSSRASHRRCASANEQRETETDKHFSELLTVRGMKVTEPERPSFPPRKYESKTRPNSATKRSERQYQAEQGNVTVSQSQNQPVLFHGYNSLKTEFEPVKDLQGTRMVLSARRSEKKINGGETTAFGATDLEDGSLDSKATEYGVRIPFGLNEVETEEKGNGNIQTSPENSAKGVKKSVPDQTVYQVEGTSGESKHYERNAPGTEIQYAWMAVDKTKASTPKPRQGKARASRSTAKQPLGVASARGFYFLNSPPKSHTVTQSTASVVREIGGDNKYKSTTDQKDDEFTREDHTSFDRFSPVYQKYLASNKHQQKRLSIMQTREVFQHEHTFRAKYSVSAPPGKSSNQTGTVASEETEQHDTRHHVEAIQRDELNCRESGAAKLPQRSKQSPPSVKPGYTKGVVIHTEHRELSLTGSKSSATKEKRESVRSQARQTEPDGVEPSSAPIPQPNTRSVYNELKAQTQNREMMNASSELSPKQQDSLQRMKQKELMMLVEEEKQKITKELQDKERIKIIQQYLDDVYAKQEPEEADTKVPRTQRNYKVTRQGRLYSLQSRNEETAMHCQGSSLKVITRPAPILHYSHQTPNKCNMAAANRVAFKNDGRSSTARDKVRFFNDWNKTTFINYVNSKGELRQIEEVTDHDPSLQMQLNDASYWLQRHFSGVMAKTATNAAVDPSQAPSRQQ